MPIKPNDYKCICPKCGYSKIVIPKSDVDMFFPICPKCEVLMDRKDLNMLDKLFTKANTVFSVKFK